ncbi:MAG: tetratricopeptide repeat protein [Leptospiraceae bacterium]|nr:tetratricopeptide repeat protein [Leptospiraceae bacterium]
MFHLASLPIQYLRIVLNVFLFFLLTTPIFSVAKIQVEELEYLGPPAENWLVSGMRSTVTNDLRLVSGSHNFEVVTVEDQNEALKTAGEKKKAGAKIDLSAEAAKILAVDFRCVGSVQNPDNVVRVTLRLLKAPDYKVWKSTTTDKKRSELLDLQNVVVYNLLNDIDGKLTNEDKKIIEIAKPKSLTAYELYAQGLKIKDTNPKQALLFYEQAIELDENYIDALSAAGSTTGITLNLFSKAENYLLRVEKILRNRGDANTLDYAIISVTLSGVYRINGYIDKAIDFYLKSKTIRDNLRLQNTSGYAVLMNNLGNAYGDKGDLDKELEFYLKDKAIEDNLGLQNTSGYADLMKNIGIVYEKNGNKPQASKSWRKAYDIYSKLGFEKKASEVLKWAEDTEK